MQRRYPCRPGSSSHTASGCKCQPGKKSTPCKPGQSSVCCESKCPVLCGKLCKKDCGKVQVIELATGVIDPTADTVVLDRVDWKSKSTSNGVGFVNKCALYKLPKTGCEGQRILFYNHHNAISILQHPWPLGTDENGKNVPPGSPDSNAEFWHVTLSHHDDVVELEWIDYNHGWTIIRQEGDIHVQSLRGVSPKYIYSLCTLRRMNGGYRIDNGGEGFEVPLVEPPNVEIEGETGKSLARDWISVVDLEPSSVNYGKIVYKAFGSIPFSSDDSENQEYHHGDLLDIGGQRYLAAPSLSFNKSYIDVFSLDSRDAPTLSGVIAPNQAALGESTAFDADSCDPQAAAFHTTHQNHQTGKILISHLGSAQSIEQADPTRDSGPGGFVQISEDVKTFALEQYYQRADADVGGPALQTVTNYQKLTGNDANGKPYSPFMAANLTEGAPPVADEFQYDFTINDCTNTLVCTSWGPPSSFDNGFSLNAPYGRTIRVLAMPEEDDKEPHNPGQPAGCPKNLTVQKNFETFPPPFLGGPEDGEGVVPLEVRRTHVPGQEIYFVGITLPGAMDLVQKKGNVWEKKIIITPAQLATDCESPLLFNGPGQVPGLGGNFNAPIPLVTDITLSEDDQFLYVSCWLAGVLLQYNVKDPENPVLVGGVANLGGITSVTADGANNVNPNSYEFDTDKTFAGGPQMLRLDPAGYNLYVTNSLFSSWDDQFFPQDDVPNSKDGSLLTNGGMMIKLNTGVRQGKKTGPMTIDTSFGTNGVIPYKDLTLQARTKDGDYKNVQFTSRVHEGHIIGVRH